MTTWRFTASARPRGPTGLLIPANGMRAFAALSAAEVLLSCGRVVERLRMHSSDGTAAGAADLAQVWPGIGPSVAVHRARALRALAAWCPVVVREGAGVQALNQPGTRESGAHVAATLKDGSATEYDLVVGADGAHSTVRSQL